MKKPANAKRAALPKKADPAEELFPSRVERSHEIGSLRSAFGKNVAVVGRVLDVGDDFFLLADESGSIRVLAPELPELLSIVEIQGRVVDMSATPHAGAVIEASAGRELVPAGREPANERQWEQFLLAPERREIVRARAALLAGVRRFFEKKNFLEVDTPSLVAVPGMEPYLNPLTTEVARADGAIARGAFVTSPEYALKKLLVAGFERIFEISRSFRNGEELGGLHNPEFLMLEWYRAYASYKEIMDDAEALVRFLAQSVIKKDSVRVRGTLVNLTKPWERISVAEAFQKYAAIDLEKNVQVDAFRRTLRAKGYRPQDKEGYDDLFFRVFLQEIEPCLGRKVPTLIYDYPAQLAALSKRSSKDPRFAERFEVYIAGMEIANAFTELNDPEEQEKRLREEYAARKKMRKPLFGPDQDFLNALRTGMPPSGGIALGLDRLIMILLEKERIEDVRLFPANELFQFKKRKQ